MLLWQQYHRRDALHPIRWHMVLINPFIAGDFNFHLLIRMISGWLLNYKVSYLSPSLVINKYFVKSASQLSHSHRNIQSIHLLICISIDQSV